MIRRRAYHLQSQGSIEVANRTFKVRLAAYQASLRRRDWAALLVEVAFQINTSVSNALPHRKTPYDVWFGRSRRWMHYETVADQETEDEGNIEIPADDEADDEAEREPSLPRTATQEPAEAPESEGIVMIESSDEERQESSSEFFCSRRPGGS
jgi:hypothetical protein